MRKIALMILVLGAFAVGACGASNEEKEARAIETIASKAAPATAAQIDRVGAGLEDGFSLRHVYRARSEAHERAYFVAGELVGPGADGQVGVWFHLRTPADPGLTFSVNGYAKEFSGWGDGSTTDAEVTMNDSPARELERFVEQRASGHP